MRLNVMVITTYIEQATTQHDFIVQESQKVIDYNNSSDRKWLANHCFWAMNNSRKVETFPVIRNPVDAATWVQSKVLESN